MADIKVEFPELAEMRERLERIEQRLNGIEEKPASDGRLISRSELAKILGVTPMTIGRWADSGLIHGYIVGTRRRYRLDEVLSSLPETSKQAQQ